MLEALPHTDREGASVAVSFRLRKLLRSTGARLTQGDGRVGNWSASSLNLPFDRFVSQGSPSHGDDGQD
ncbi:MAG TPA: hypothetical protein VF783_26800, partial [Terriglobales bacterium]